MLRSEILARFDSLGILPTSQRLEIAAILLEKAQHLSVEQVLTRLRAKDSTVSKATVYNSLNLFGKKGLIKECLVDPERRYYDSTTSPHHHFFNSDTGASYRKEILEPGASRDAMDSLVAFLGRAPRVDPPKRKCSPSPTPPPSPCAPQLVPG